VLVVERNFAEFSGEITCDHLSVTSPVFGLGAMMRRR
jgi:hypothetical protein